MFYLIWQMGLILLVAFGLGLFFGRQIWSGEARAVEADKALAEADRLRRENENLARRVGEAERRTSAPAPAAVEEIKSGAAAMPDIVDTPKPKAMPKAKAAPAKAEKPAPAPVAEPVADTAAPTEADDLTRIKGLGPKAAAALVEGGVTRFAQIADWSESDVADWDARINGRGRITRDNWVGQAKDLA